MRVYIQSKNKIKPSVISSHRPSGRANITKLFETTRLIFRVERDQIKILHTHHRLLSARRGFLRGELLEGEAGRAVGSRLLVQVQIASLQKTKAKER